MWGRRAGESAAYSALRAQACIPGVLPLASRPDRRGRVAGRLVRLFRCRILRAGGGKGPRQRAVQRRCPGLPRMRRCRRRGVKVVEVNRPDDLLGDTRREGDRDPILLALLGIPGALAAEMGGVRQVTPRLVLEAVPLAEEVVPAVIANLGDLGMHHRHLGDVRSVNDHLATVGDDRLQLVEALGRGPDVLILGRHDRQHASTGASR